MPASVIPEDKRGKPLLSVLFWFGVALAPVAALILLVADGNGPLRVAAVLAILAVVLIGLSIALRADGDGQVYAEELFDELEQLRRELRAEVVAAAQSGNQALVQAQRAQEGIGALHRRLGADNPVPAAAESGVGAGRARVSIPDEYDAPEYPDARSGRNRHSTPQEAPPGRGHHPGQRDDEQARVRRPQPAGRYAAERPVPERPGVYGAAPRPAVHEIRPAGVPGDDPDSRPVGVVRHTETVHVTTRHTIVGRPGADPGAGNFHGGGHPGRWAAAPGPVASPGERPWVGPGPESDDRSWGGYAEPGEGSWSDSGEERSWSGQGGQRDDRSWGAPAEEPHRGRSSQPDDDEAEEGNYWSQLRSGNRWATVRDDERGRELRVGERRAAVHADGAGTELRVEDRWAAVRRGETRRDHAGRDGGNDRGDGGWAEPEGPPALPAGGVPVPEEWRAPAGRRGYPPADDRRAAEPEPARRRHQRAEEERYGYPPQDEVPRAGGARAADRWH